MQKQNMSDSLFLDFLKNNKLKNYVAFLEVKSSLSKKDYNVDRQVKDKINNTISCNCNN